MESNLEGPLTDDPSNDGNKKDNPTTVEDDDSKIEIEVQISTTEIDNVEEEIEERSLSIDENAVTPNKEEIITTEEKVDEAMKEETPCTEENVLTELDKNSSTGEKNTTNDFAEKEQEIHSTDENNSEKLEDRVDSTQSLEENVDEAMQEETHCTEEHVLTVHDENSSTGEKNTTNDLTEKEQDIHSTDENNSEKLEDRVDSTQSLEENEKLEDRLDSPQSLEENVTPNKDEIVTTEEKCNEVMKEETPCTEENENLQRVDTTQSLKENENLQSVDSTQSLEENGVKELHKDSSMDLNEIGVEGDVPDSTKENGVSKALKRPFEEIEDQSSSEGSDDEESRDGSGSSESDNEDINKVSKVVKIKASESKTYPSSKKRKIDCAPIEINFNEAYHNPDFIKSLSSAFSGKTKMKFENGASILAEPFTCCVLPNFIDSEEFINKVKTEVEEIEVESKMNDLYKFKQSVDLADFPSSEIQTIYNLLKQKCVKWLSEVTNIPLIDKMDMFCSCYTYTDHLLCHDDELEGRRIAYIYYLTPPNWEKKDGGLLDLFNAVDGEPSEVVHSFVPTCNNFIFFEVGPTSYHQVSEVLAYKTRTALSGWFYGPPLERTLHSSELVLFQSPSYCIVDIRDWVNPIYLKPDTQLHIRGSFEESSEMELMDFLQNAKYEMVCQALTEKIVSWKKIGPQNRRNYEELDDSDVPPILKECQNLFCCEPFFLVLSNLTGLRFHPLCAETEVKMGEVNSSIRKWGHGSYSLLHENSFFKFATLNAALCFNCPDWETECGGYTSYVAKNKKDELLRVDPKPNSLALVYITKKTSFFVKYVNSLVTERSIPYFQDIFSVYREIE